MKSPPFGCDEFDVTYTATVSTDVVTWDWTFDVAPNAYSGATPPPVHYNTPGNHPVSLTVANANGCATTDNDFITVYSSPVAGIALSSLCEGDTANFSSASTTVPGQPITNYTWYFGDGDTSTDTNPEHYYDIPTSYTVSLVVETQYCSDSTSLDITVEPRPFMDVDQSILSGCSPLEVAFTNNSTGAISYLWNFGNGSTSIDAEPTATFYNFTQTDTTYVVTVTGYNAFGCSNTDTLYVTVFAGAYADFNDGGLPPGCAPFEVNFVNNSINAGSYFWDLGDGTTSTLEEPTHLYDNTTGFIQTFDVTLIAYSVNGCNDTVTHPIVVYPLANFDFDLTSLSGCSPLTVTMPYVSGAQTYLWDFGDGQTSTFPIPTHTFNNFTTNPIEYTVTLTGTSAFGCSDVGSSTITVNPGPIAQFNLDVTSGCSPLEVNMTNVSINGFQFGWNYGDNESSTNGDAVHSHIFENNTNSVVTYNIELTAISADGCSHTFSLPVQVFPAVTATFVDPGNVCGPINLQLNNTSVNATSFSWDFGNGIQSTQEDPIVFYGNVDTEPVTYTIQLMAMSSYGCSDVATGQVTVHPSPIAAFSIDESAACEPAPVAITNESQYATNYVWNYGDGSSSINGDPMHVHTYAAPGNNLESYVIHLSAYNAIGCVDTTSIVFNLFPEVYAAFTTDTVGCGPHIAPFVNQSIGASSYEWSFGDGAVSSLPSPTHTYGTTNTDDSVYAVQLVAENLYGCTDTATVNIHVFHTPVAIVNIDSLFGCYPQNVTFSNESIGADSYTWAYGTGETSTTSDPLHTHVFYNFSNTTANYTVTLTASTVNGCSSTDQVLVQVSPELNADFTANGQGCSPMTVLFDNNTDGGWSYQWNFGDGETSNLYEPTHTFFNFTDEDITYNVTLIVQNLFGCVDTADAFVTVYPIPQVNFTAAPEEQTWPNATVVLDNLSIGGNLNWEWRMDDGTDLYEEEPGSYTYASWGTYDIRLIGANNFCSDTAFRTIVINPPAPVANFLGPAEGCAPLTVQFENLSEYAASSNWLFGDGGQANATNPVYTYYIPGTYTVTLTITGFDGVATSQMTLEQSIVVYPNAQAAFTVTPNEVSIPSQPVYCLNLSENATSYTWDFGDEDYSNEVNPIHYYDTEGLFTITLIANNQYNCPDTMMVYDAVYAKKGGLIDFPNAFTPDPSGANGGSYNPNSYDNDVFFPIHAGVVEYQLLIFNKWGELLYESTDVSRGWDGYYRGQLCKQDVYVWKVNARFIDGQRFEQAGDVTLLIK
ncbi:MAG: PKD domain-containing protein [Flavobacteriales bacterium]